MLDQEQSGKESFTQTYLEQTPKAMRVPSGRPWQCPVDGVATVVTGYWGVQLGEAKNGFEKYEALTIDSFVVKQLSMNRQNSYMIGRRSLHTVVQKLVPAHTTEPRVFHFCKHSSPACTRRGPVRIRQAFHSSGWVLTG